MSFEDPNILDYVDEDYDWNRELADDSGVSGDDADAEFLALLEDEAFGDSDGEVLSSDDDGIFAELDAALDEIEAEIREEAREQARPSADEVELLATWDRVYKVGSQNFICSDRVTVAPRLKSKAGCTVTSNRSDLNALLGQNLNRARLAHDERKAK